MSSFLEQLAQAYMERERQRLGIPEQERKAAESQLSQEAARQLAAMNALKIRGAESELAYEPTKRKMAEEESAARVFNLREPNHVPAERKPPDVGSFTDYVVRKYGQNPTPEQIAEARKVYQQADDRPREQRARIQLVFGEGGLQRVDKDTGKSSPVTAAGGGSFQPGPTADMRNKEQARGLVKGSIDAIDSLGQRIITKAGPQQRLNAAKRGVEAVFGADPEFRTYQDARMALAGNLAVAQQGSRPSDADIKAIWLPLVPDAFRDTSESAKMKWDLIRRMSHVPSNDTDNMPIDIPSLDATVGTGASAGRRIRFDAKGNVVP